MKKRRRWLWMLSALALFGLAAWLMSRQDPPTPEATISKVTFPTRMRGPDFDRQEKRRTLILKALKAVPKMGDSDDRIRDPVLAALPRGKGKTVVVLEANAIRNSPIGNLLLDCLRSEPGNNLDKMKDRLGIDPLTDLDRMVVTDDGVMFSGNFKNAKWDELLAKSESRVAYGANGTLYTAPPRPDGTLPPVFARWKDEMVIISDTLEEAQAAIDQLEGGGSTEPPPISEEDTYGEVYGVISGADLAKMVPPDQAALAEKIAAAASQVKLHVDAMNDVGIVADVNGTDSSQVESLGKTLGAALALGRLQAQATGKDDLAQLLELAKISPEGGTFRAQLALPLPLLEQKLAFCRERLDGGSASAQVAPAPPQ